MSNLTYLELIINNFCNFIFYLKLSVMSGNVAVTKQNIVNKISLAK